ncbi:DUF3653 domain-containing protein [Enterovibrio norvegicus]|uniref:DUF3653 domain-containing protein n=1 Tax=Enterovibrio norvegicus TaxID=188144 RepID=UPI001E5A44CA|nr:DUF3653 domain-containing protein [Enterovibrio norvegicus]MCC4796994.1 phage protein [Enterovibrio norvegicus]
MQYESFFSLYWRVFDSIDEGAAFFHVRRVTILRWLSGDFPINPMAEKLLIIKARGYLPNDMNWQGFRINEHRAVIITPEGREFAPRELDCFPIWKAEYYALREKHGRIEAPPHQPALAPAEPFRGGRRQKAAPWIPTRDK